MELSENSKRVIIRKAGGAKRELPVHIMDTNDHAPWLITCEAIRGGDIVVVGKEWLIKHYQHEYLTARLLNEPMEIAP